MPYAIIKLDTGEVVWRADNLPKAFDVPIDGRNRRIVAPVTVGDEGLGYRFVNWMKIGFDQPGRFFTQGSDSDSFDGVTTLTTTRSWIAWTQAEITASETARRQALADGFADIDDVTRAATLVLGKAIRDIFTAVGSGGTLAQMQNRIATVAANTPSTPAEFKTAVLARLGT